MKLYLSPAHRIGAKPYGSNHNLVPISNHAPNIYCEVWDLLLQNLKPLRTFLEVILVVTFEFMIVKFRSHIPKNGLNISTGHRFEVTLYILKSLYSQAFAIRSSLWRVALEIPKAAAASSYERPPKNRSSMTWLLRSSRAASRLRDSSNADRS